MKKVWNFVSYAALVAVVGCAGVARAANEAAKDAKVFIISPKDGEKVTSPFVVKFGIQGMELVPAGTPKPHSGHHHLLIDTDLPDLSKPIPTDAKHIHFGKAQTETTVTLTPGKHTLQLLLGDQNHVPHGPAVKSEKITVEVTK